VAEETGHGVEDIDKTRAALYLIETLLRKPEQRLDFRSAKPDQRVALLERRGVPGELAGDILQLITRIPNLPAPPEPEPDDDDARRANGKPKSWTDDMVREWHKVSMEPFRRIRKAYLLSMMMSAVLFVVGITLFALAAGRALLEGSASSETLLIAGLGTVDFIALVYTRPLKDIAVSLAQTQRAGILAMTYHAGLPLLRGDEAALDNLERLTKLVTAEAGTD
jgi:hypothetical protein